MDFVTLAFLALIALVSGGIAVFADSLGRKLGKKRLRLGALRPKHTAAVGVFSSGVIISVVTIGLMYALSSDVREWISEGRRALVLRDHALKDLGQAKELNSQLAARNTLLQKNTKLNEDQIYQAKCQLADLEKQRKDLLEQSKGLVARLATARQQYGETLSSLSVARSGLANLNEKYRSLKWSYDSLYKNNKDLSAQNDKLVQSNINIEKQSESLKEANKALLDTNDLYVKTASELKENITKLNAAVDAKTLTLSQMEVEASKQTVLLDQMGAKVAQAQRQLDMEQKQLELLTVQSNELKSIFDNSRIRPLIFSRSEELARLSIPAHLTAEQASASLTSLLRAAREIAEQRGAKSAKKEIPVAGIFSQEDAKTHRAILPDEIVAKLIKRIAGQPHEQVLVASSSLNAFEDEPVSLDITAFPNPLVYKGGQVLAETNIDGASDRIYIYGRITNFLKGKVRDRVKTDHMIRYADDSFGQIKDEEILKLLDDVRAMDRPIRLQALAETDTRAGDPLKIDFRIR